MSLPIGLLAVVALLYGWVGFAAGGWDRVLALAGAVTILAALAVASRSAVAATTLLVVGALPLAVMTWWSIVTPVLALLALLLARPAIVHRRSGNVATRWLDRAHSASSGPTAPYSSA